MAEAFMNKLGDDRFTAESAGLEPGKLNPLAVEVMKETGIDISGNKTKSVFNFLKQGETYDYVVTVCDEASGERCPFFPGKTVRLHWSIDDPAAFEGTDKEKLEKTRVVRDLIKEKIKDFIANYQDGTKLKPSISL